MNRARPFPQRIALWLLAPTAWLLLATMPAPAQATTLSTGYDTSCSVSNDWVAQCWGAVPLAKTGTAGIADLRAGKGFNCALRKDETVSCWGDMGSLSFGPQRATRRARPLRACGRPPSWPWAPPTPARSAGGWCTAGAMPAGASAVLR